MNSKVKGGAEQVLMAAGIFILFLLLVEDRLVVPVWLQAVGRMHPLLLHFPITLLLLAMGMEFFRFRSTYATNPFYRTFLDGLLLSGALLSALTVIMGLLLAQEEGYTGQVLTWHKWTGVGVFALAAGLYFCRYASWYKVGAARTGAALTVLVLLLAGHYGATLTHGDGFLVEPLMGQKQEDPVPLEEALVFDHVIQPIFQQKCVSCHNPEKIKGGLLLTDEASIRKGGKTGKLFVSGNPEQSLLLQRIHLPEEEKKHMPPKGKVQLTTEEMALLSWWIKGRADFRKKVVDLPPTDSLRILAAGLFNPGGTTEFYTFAAADEAIIQKLTTNYRSIAPLARESPALSVNIYNKNEYAPEQIEELSELKKQIVFLNLSKMPVKDADLKKISQFENLQKLNLNFTDITGKRLGDLSTLTKLKSLSLAGTQVTYSDLRKPLGAIKSLQTVSVWNTGLADSDVQRLQKEFPNIHFIVGFRDDGENPLRLNPPQVGNRTTVFTESLPMQLKHPIRGVQIRYTTDGTQPDSVHSPVFREGTQLRTSTSVKARAYKEGWLGSEVAQFHFYRSTHKPDSVRLLLPLNRVHQAEGNRTFFNEKLGTFNANSPAWANNWAGVRDNDMVFVAEFKQPVTISSVALRTMVEPENGIFPPATVEVWGGTSESQMKLLGTYRPAVPTKETKPSLSAYGPTFKPQAVTFIRIVARPLNEMPAWHNNKGRKALLLVDEVFVN
ncbi:c-type cytochrome domain-containing protein [Telluribacter sp. SYSU D00476]|uniref:c-type cytochrome domain-containing protein n=1 Tax=Telluribacter sp. SYSU D00476 TaxID=2811430 RepID=UPI001FF4BF6E|nr:c-type cytochrome domain-containing protein [Telluribacter sp. SYSU D00476]